MPPRAEPEHATRDDLEQLVAAPLLAWIEQARVDRERAGAERQALLEQVVDLRARLERMEARIPQALPGVDPEKIYTCGTAAGLVGLSRQTLYLKAKAKEIETIPTGTEAIRFKGRALIAYLTRRERTPEDRLEALIAKADPQRARPVARAGR